MTDVSESRMNVAALKRVDPYVKDILDTATHVALYTFNEENNEWDKTDVEGALFVYSRNGEPYNSIVIMNRLNTENQVEPVTKDLDLQLQEPFLLYRNSKCHIYGIWFYDKDECVRISSMLNKLIKESGNCNKNNTKGKKNSQRNSNNVDIFSMLSKAQEDFNTNRGTSQNSNNTSSGGSGSISASKSPTKNHNDRVTGPLSAPLGPDVTSQSVMDFFAKAKVNTGHFKGQRDQPTPGKVVSNNDTKPLLARLMSNPAAHLEHIEKQQRSITPQPTAGSGIHLSSTAVVQNNAPVSATNSRSKRKNRAVSQCDNVLPSINQEAHQHALNSSSHSDANGSSGFLRIQSPISNQNHRANCNTSNSIPLTSLFTHSSENAITEDNVSTPIVSRQTASGSAPALIPPLMFATRSPAEPQNRPFELMNRPVEPLTRNQLLQAFNYLLRSDPDFVNKLHEAYVKSFSEILS